MKTKKTSLVALLLILTMFTSVMPFPITFVKAQNSDPKIVYVVICIDSEIWGSHDSIFGNMDPHPTVDVREWARSPPSTVSQVFESGFRNSHLDSFGKIFKVTWFAEMDYLMAQSNFVYADGSPAGVSGYTAIHDILMNNWGTEIQTYGDSIEYHHHLWVYDENFGWLVYDNGPDAGYPEYQMCALDHMIIDQNFYPSTFRSGWLLMPTTLSNWLEQWMPFDYTPDSGIWYPVHPSGMNRWQTKAKFWVYEWDVDTAFERARDYGSAIYSFYCHDIDDLASFVNSLQGYLDTADANEAMYPNVSFKYVSAREAMQRALGFTDFTPPTFTVTSSGDTYTITSSELLWANHPYVVLRCADGTYMHVEATPTGTNTWIVTQPTGAAIETIGVAACDQYGNPGVELAAGVRFESVYHTFSVDPISHDDYGLTYPATYEFSIPNGVSNLKAYKRFTSEEGWVRIVEKTSNDFFNGIEAVRFDYSKNRAYVSVSFASYSDCIYIYFADSGNEVSTEFIGITEYYDNRRVAVVFTLDDVTGDPDSESASVVFADANIWLTAGIITMEPSWQTIQDAVDRGYLEIASHSRTHPAPPYSDYDSEIGGSKEDIITNLNLPYPYRKGNKEYVWCWIEPYGDSDDMVQYTLGVYKYLVSRKAYVESWGPTYYEEWNSAYGLFNRATSTILMDSTELTDLNNMFDYVYSLGGIYHAWGHPRWIGWEAGENGYEHIQYVKEKKDVWYVGFGALYAYAYTRMHVQSMSVAISPTHVKMYFGQSQTFNSSFSGGNPPYSYQWYLNDSQVPDATGSTWTFMPTSAGSYKVYLWVTDNLNVKAQSNVVRDILVYSQLSVSIGPASVKMTVGGSQMFTSTVSGGVSPYSYQWYLNDGQVLGATGSAWMFTPTSAGTYKIYLRVADNYAATAQSNSATARVETPMIVAITPTYVEVYFGQSQTFSSAVSGGTPPYLYQWYLNDNAVAGATGSSWMFTPRSTGNYKVYLKVTDGLNFEVQSNVVTDVFVYSVYLFLTVEPNQARYMRGRSVTFTVNVFNQLNPVLESTLTLTVTGPRGYGFYDFQPINVAADTVGEYSFTWVVPNVGGKYVVEVGLVPSLLTAYDTVWLEAA